MEKQFTMRNRWIISIALPMAVLVLASVAFGQGGGRGNAAPTPSVPHEIRAVIEDGGRRQEDKCENHDADDVVLD